MYKPTTNLWQPTLPTFLKFSVLGAALASLGLTGCSSTHNANQTAKASRLDLNIWMAAVWMDWKIYFPQQICVQLRVTVYRF